MISKLKTAGLLATIALFPQLQFGCTNTPTNSTLYLLTSKQGGGSLQLLTPPSHAPIVKVTSNPDPIKTFKGTLLVIKPTHTTPEWICLETETKTRLQLAGLNEEDWEKAKSWEGKLLELKAQEMTAHSPFHYTQTLLLLNTFTPQKSVSTQP